jgi:uncharacterized protein (TIGR00251 family)
MIIEVKVTPKASSNRLVEADGTIQVYVTTAPEDGKANKAVIRLLAKHYGVARSRISIIRGETSRNKTVEINNISSPLRGED